MASPIPLCSLLFPSSSGMSPFPRGFSLSGMMLTLVRMCDPGTIRLVRVHGAIGLVELLGQVSLID